MEEPYSQAQKREFDAQVRQGGPRLRRGRHPRELPPQPRPGEEDTRLQGLRRPHQVLPGPVWEFQKCYSNGKDDSDGLAEPLPPYSASLALTIDTLVRLGFVIWPCLPERDGRDGVMFVHHEHGIMDAEAFHLLNISGLTYQNAAVGAVVSAIMYVNGDLPPVCDPMGEDVEIDPDDFL
jgi:hypothetical protein